MFKENENLKKREYDFKGLLDSGELEADLVFKEKELADYKEKLREERQKNEEFTQELKDEILKLKQRISTLQNDKDARRKLQIFEKETNELRQKT